MLRDRADTYGSLGNHTRGFRRQPGWKDRKRTPPARRRPPKLAYVLRVTQPPLAHDATAAHPLTFSAGLPNSHGGSSPIHMSETSPNRRFVGLIGRWPLGSVKW